MNIAAYPKYESYRDSGIEWIGKIPSHWHMKRAGFLLNELNVRSKDGSEPLLSLSKTQGVIRRDSMAERGGQAESLIGYKKVSEGDIVINRMQAANGLLSMSKVSGITSPDYAIYETKLGAGIRSDIAATLLQQPEYQGEIRRRVKGVMEGFIRLYSDDLFRLPMICAPLTEQHAIAAFLNEKCAKIDEAVRIKEEQIKLLRERRQILIQQAVTRGLNPDAPMKDSGIDWIGQIPAHWEVQRFRFLCSITTGGRNTEDREEYGLYPFFVRSQTPERINTYSYDGEAILTAGDGAGVGKVYHYVDGKFDFHQRVYKFSDFKDVLGKYLFHYISANFANVALLGTAKSTVDSLRLPLIQNFEVVFPKDNDEQLRIVQVIEAEDRKIVDAISIKEHQITALKEYKTTLINAAVTGKIKVF